MNIPSTGVDSRKLQSAVGFFSSSVADLRNTLKQLSAEIPADAVPQRGDGYHQRTLAAFEQSRIDCGEFSRQHADDPAFIKETQKNFLDQTNPEFMQSWYAQRARTKPNGFVGDYDMLSKIYDEKTPAAGLGGYLDICLGDLTLPCAVRGRLKAAKAFLVEEIGGRTGKVRVLDVASGPCREYLDWPRFTNQEVEVVAMDTDPQALSFVQTNVCPIVTEGTTLTPVRYNALRTSVAASTIRQFGKFDIIYSVGLCDYLTDEQLIRMFIAWKETLNEGGTMFVAFKDCERYDHTPYQWHLDWYFYQRTREDSIKLFEQAGIAENEMQITRDETGVILNFVYRSPSPAYRRVDLAQAIAPNLGGIVEASTSLEK
jgi:extracellular factor (EF) 3-hydroxypalmitic acid methyl ester biosynthesis protein